MIQIAPSLLSCDFSQLGEEIWKVESGGCDLLHLDVMDGHFVPNITFGPVIIEGIRKLTKLPLDVHLMIENPIRWVERFAKAGADWISFHIETAESSEQVIEIIKKLGKKAGIALNPDTPLKLLDPYLDKIDFVLIMTVNPGFGGQNFISHPLEKVKTLSKKECMDRARPCLKVEVDGGIKLNNVKLVAESGANIIVSGSGIFHTPNPIATLKKFRRIVKNVTQM